LWTENLSPLQRLNQETQPSDAAIYTDSNATETIANILNQTQFLLNETLSGSGALDQIKNDVDAGIGVFVNIARNNLESPGNVPVGPKLLYAIESTLIGFGAKVLTDSNAISVSYDFSNGVVGVRRGDFDAEDIFYPRNHTAHATYIHIPNEWLAEFHNEYVTYIATLMPGTAFANDLEPSGSTITDAGSRKVLNSEVVSFRFSDSIHSTEPDLKSKVKSQLFSLI